MAMGSTLSFKTDQRCHRAQHHADVLLFPNLSSSAKPIKVAQRISPANRSVEDYLQSWALSQGTKRRAHQNEGQQAAAQTSLHKPIKFV